jgi:hypothetical protein
MTYARTLAALLAIAVTAPATDAAVKVKTPISKYYAESAVVATGKVTAVDAATGAVTAAVTTLKGDGVGDVIKVRLDNLPEVTKAVKQDVPFVLFLGRRAASNVLHLGDNWLFPEPLGGKANFVVRRDLNSQYRQTFPGTTAALSRIVDEIKTTNRTTVLDAAATAFKGGVKPYGTLTTAGLTGLFTVGSTQGASTIFPTGKDDAHALRAAADGLTAVTDTPVPFPTDRDVIALTALGDGRYAALKKDGQLVQYGNGAAPKSTALWTDGKPASAAALGNFGEDPEKTYAIVVKDDNVYRYPLDGSAPSDDFLRLTGERVTNYHKDTPNWLAGATAQPLDVNGDRRTDVLINTPSGPMLLINRGFGAFFIDPDVAKTLVGADGKPLITEKTLWTAADIERDGHDDLILVAPDGKATAVMNPKPAK